ncbi:hypothetical protein P2G88_16695 [Aliiglaciecola sp. CAU 1673]|uniref:hypothetical protein n=1 Tax=Aliiglaciecola sp. CAU 1673 TaxID=3032595 RepID=UPI0023DAA1EE|nr:hypothetical protein [Aliiglaciecola sp. CAU 1673]MDF2179893.1 hypothetical protein [Aliiglaciecola sp. CAU 1673]
MDTRSFFLGLLAISVVCLAAAISFFALKLADLNAQIPRAIIEVEKTARQIEALIAEAEQLRAPVPDILQEVSLTREQVPLILQEIAAVRQHFPAILEEINAINHHIPGVLAEAEAVRLMVPSILDEVETTREALPPMLSQADNIVREAKQIGKVATEGAVTGVLSGIVKMPFEFLGGLGKALFNSGVTETAAITEQDLALLRKNTAILLQTDRAINALSWSNPQSGRSGVISQKQYIPAEGEMCRLLNYQIKQHDTNTIDKDVTFCLDQEANWKPVLR